MSAPVTRAIALDGPAGTGKSTVARGVARALEWRYVDTGAVYRAVTLAVLRSGLGPDSPAEALLAAAITTLDGEGVAVTTDPADPRVTLGREDVTEEVRGPAVTAAVSAVSALPDVRKRLVDLQRQLAGPGGCVMEGRDIGTVVLPDAGVKVFLDADPAVRAARRAAEPTTQAEPSVADVAADLARRDRLDSTRAASPLAAAPDAVHVDTTSLTADQVVAAVLGLAATAGFR